MQGFPDSAAVAAGELALGGVRAGELAERFGTPLVVYCEETLRARARAYRQAAPGALVVYGSKAFPNVAILRLFAEEGIGADVSTLGELAFALRAGIDGSRIVMHGNNKSDEELRAAADAGALVCVDALDEVPRALAAGVTRALARVTPGVEADTHQAIRTGHHGSKFGLPQDLALEALRGLGEAALGLHLHVGSQLLSPEATHHGVERLAAFAARCREELGGWTPRVVNLGGGLGISHIPEEHAPAIGDWVSDLTEHTGFAWASHGLPQPDKIVLEPGRSLVGPAGVTLYRVGVVKEAAEETTWVAVDGGMSDNPRPLLYGAGYTAVVAGRADAPASGSYSVCGKHCESGDVLIESVPLAAPRRGDLLAVPATGGYTLGMASNYNAVPRPAAVLVGGGAARLIRRRETIDDLLALEA